MAYVVRLTDFQPSARDDAPWIGADMYESLTADGFGAKIDEFDFATNPRVRPAGVDVDPDTLSPDTPGTWTNPFPRSFTTSAATLPAAWYWLSFYDAAGQEEPTEPIFKGGVVAPSTRQVAQLLRGRTIAMGGPLGEFTPTTDPTIDEAEAAVQTATADVIAATGRMIPTEANDVARQVIAIGAAMVIEVGSEEVNEARFDRLQAMYDARLGRLIASVIDAGGTPPIPVDPTDPATILQPPEPLGIISGTRRDVREWD